MIKYKEYADNNQIELYKKFPSTHFLSNQNNVMNVIAYCTFWRRNMHLFCIDYLKIKLYEYQQLAIYELGISSLCVIIASRNDAKSFILALYACCRCILYPGTKFVIGSSTKGQAKLIVSEKIQNELAEWSKPLKDEISQVSTSVNDIYVKFKNGSRITVYVANDNARGLRSNVSGREEFRMINKKIEDSVIAPFQTVRNQPYMLNPFYGNNEILQEEPVDLYISSSWISAARNEKEAGNSGNHWMWDVVDQAFDGMMKKDGSVLLAYDESITLKHHLKTMKQLITQKKKQDPITWKTEFLNLKVRQSLSSYFTYSMLMKRQILKQVFYPRTDSDFRTKKKNKFAIPLLDNEIRIISCDISFVTGDKNDASVYTCGRGIPQYDTYENSNASIEVTKGYHRQVNYIESNQIGDTTEQAIRIRELYEDYGDGGETYIVLDTRNGGIQILYALQKVLYDEKRGVEYPPLLCMNNSEYAKVCQDPSAKPCIFAVNASLNLNSDIAIGFRKALIENKIDFLVNYNTAKEEILSENDDYNSSIDTDIQLDYEKPFFETQALISECAELQYEKLANTNAIKIYEKGNNRKDRYTSVSYFSYFLDLMELDLTTSTSDYDYDFEDEDY